MTTTPEMGKERAYRASYRPTGNEIGAYPRKNGELLRGRFLSTCRLCSVYT